MSVYKIEEGGYFHYICQWNGLHWIPVEYFDYEEDALIRLLNLNK